LDPDRQGRARIVGEEDERGLRRGTKVDQRGRRVNMVVGRGAEISRGSG